MAEQCLRIALAKYALVAGIYGAQLWIVLGHLRRTGKIAGLVPFAHRHNRQGEFARMGGTCLARQTGIRYVWLLAVVKVLNCRLVLAREREMRLGLKPVGRMTKMERMNSSLLFILMRPDQK